MNNSMSDKIILVILTILLLLNSSYGQHPSCSHDEESERIFELANDISKQNKLEAKRKLESYTKSFAPVAASRSNGVSDLVIGYDYIIPTVVHIIHNGGGASIIDSSVVVRQLELVNTFFQGSTAYDHLIDPDFVPVRGSFTSGKKLKFVLAGFDPDGNPTSGIEKIQDTTYAYTTRSNTGLRTTYNWPREKYFNIYIVDGFSDTGSSGFATFPFSVDDDPEIDGTVLQSWAFGEHENTKYFWPMLLVHEIGHWLNLYHIWSYSDKDCLNDDEVSDTPNTSGNNFFFFKDFPGIGAVTNCSTKDNITNMMDYTGPFYAMFTSGQQLRMEAALNAGTAQKKHLWSEENVLETIYGVNETIVDWSSMRDATAYPKDANNTINAPSGSSGISTTINFEKSTDNTTSNGVYHYWDVFSSDDGLQLELQNIDSTLDYHKVTFTLDTPSAISFSILDIESSTSWSNSIDVKLYDENNTSLYYTFYRGSKVQFTAPYTFSGNGNESDWGHENNRVRIVTCNMVKKIELTLRDNLPGNYPKSSYVGLSDIRVYHGCETDSDGDKIPDSYDDCPNLSVHDTDEDGVCDDSDPCIGFENVDLDAFPGTPDACDTNYPIIDFSTATINDYSGQDAGISTNYNNGATFYTANNGWKAIEYNYTVTPNTIVEFDFKSTLEGEIHGIGFDTDYSLPMDKRYHLFGFQNVTGSSEISLDYQNYSNTGEYKHYKINIGEDFTGSISKIVLFADNDIHNDSLKIYNDGTSFFRNLKIYEEQSLPIELTRFKINGEDCRSYLEWEVANPENFSHFEIEFSVDAKDFKLIKAIPLKDGRDGFKYNYSTQFIDGYFRLKLVDLDGSSAYSDIQYSSSNCQTKENIVVYPNPIQKDQGALYIRTHSDKGWLDNFSIYNAQGMLMREYPQVEANETKYFQVDLTGFPSGMYFIQFDGRSKHQTFTIVE